MPITRINRYNLLFIPTKNVVSVNANSNQINSLAIENWARTLFPNWTKLAFSTGWSNYTTIHPVQYRKVSDIVFMRHIAFGKNDIVAILPPGYRPSTTVHLPGTHNGSFIMIEIKSNGNVEITSASSDATLVLTAVQFSVL